MEEGSTSRNFSKGMEALQETAPALAATAWDDNVVAEMELDKTQVVIASAEGGGAEGVSSMQETVWKEMAEAWFNAIQAGWGPGSPVWDDMDAANNFLLQSDMPFADPNQLELHDAESSRKQQHQNLGSSSSSSSAPFPPKPFFRKDDRN
ncbi:hypothetical protein MLD38_019995 [Melastoma candidum]|nr:hypothetical protein MLD38_019995 [Melastoma candidum]